MTGQRGRPPGTAYDKDYRDLLTASRGLNDNDLPETPEWARIFANETAQSQRAALAVLAGTLNAPLLLRRMADRLEGRT